MKSLSVGPYDAGQRLDKYLARMFKEADQGFLYRMLRKKNIVLNGSKASGSEKLKEGDRVDVFFSDETFAKFRGAAAPESVKKEPVRLSVVYEDEQLLFVNKPAGLLTQKADKEGDSLTDRIAAYAAQRGERLSEGFAAAAANRLDRNTSGLVLAGKTLPAQQLLSYLLRDRLVEKYYLCVVKGCPAEPFRSVLYWRKNEEKNLISILKEAAPDAERVELKAWPRTKLKDGFSLLRVQLISGKSHQIRAQLAYLGYPVAGDPKYGSRDANRELSSLAGETLHAQLLHSYEVRFPEELPETAELSETALKAWEAVKGHSFRAPLSAVFVRFYKALGGIYGE